MRKLEVNYQNMTIMMMLESSNIENRGRETRKMKPNTGKGIQIQNQTVIHHQ
jgi:hypothetical protein